MTHDPSDELTATIGPFRLLVRAAGYGRGLGRPALLAVVATTLAAASRVAGPLVIRVGVDDGVLARDMDTLTFVALAYLVMIVAQYFTSWWSLYAIGVVGERYLRALRVRVFDHLMSLDMPFYDRAKTGVLVARMTSDVESLNEFAYEGAFNVLSSMLTVIGVGVAMLFVDPVLALAVFALMPFLVVASLIFRHYSTRAYRQVRERVGRMLATLQEGIIGVRVVQAYTTEDHQAVRFGRVNRQYYEAQVDAARAISAYFPVVDFFRALGSAVVLVIGGLRVIEGDMTFGSLLAFLLYVNWFFEPIVQLSNTYNLLQAATAALAKLFGLLDAQPRVAEPTSPEELPEPMRGELRFDGVGFGYGDTPVLADVDLVVQPGERITIVGQTGAGKSTLAKLAVRFYDPDRGSVLLDGVDLRAVRRESLRRRIAVVPQEGYLFRGSLRDNVAYGLPHLSDDDIWKVCDTLGIADWVQGLPERLDTELRERGSRLSSGERQLVALARALASDPAVIVLDEATSNLDPGMEERVERALAALLMGRTTLIIAHRLQTARRADRVIVMEGGRIVESGKPRELAAQDGPYARFERVWADAEFRIA